MTYQQQCLDCHARWTTDMISGVLVSTSDKCPHCHSKNIELYSYGVVNVKVQDNALWREYT